jgi:hypothetical protein
MKHESQTWRAKKWPKATIRERETHLGAQLRAGKQRARDKWRTAKRCPNKKSKSKRRSKAGAEHESNSSIGCGRRPSRRWSKKIRSARSTSGEDKHRGNSAREEQNRPRSSGKRRLQLQFRSCNTKAKEGKQIRCKNSFFH